MKGSVGDLGTGVRCFVRGFALLGRTPRLLLLGALPAAVTALVYLAAFVALLFFVGDLVGWATPFADGWSDGVRGTFRFLLSAALVVGAIAVGVVTFAVVTLALGGVFYDRISARVDNEFGGTPGADAGEVDALTEARDSLRLILTTLVRMVPMSVLGMIPVVGQSVVPVAVGLTGAWFLTVELTGTSFGARGVDLDGRRRALRSRPLLALGFGVPAYVGCLIPLLAIVVMPAAVAGATLLVRELGHERTR